MSATQDKSVRPAFVYSNMYKIYKSGKAHELIEPVAVVKDSTKKLADNLTTLSVLQQKLSQMLIDLKKLCE
jgi:hypothetical protein